jgi:uncharacterized protein YqeY
MSLKERLTEDMKGALKARDSLVLSTLRMSLAAMHNKEIELGRELEEREAVEVIVSQARLRREAIEQYQRGNRPDLVAKEEKELVTLQGYLPPAMSEEEIEEQIAWAISEANATGPKDLGRVMKLLIPRTVGRADNSKVSGLARQTLLKLGG